MHQHRTGIAHLDSVYFFRPVCQFSATVILGGAAALVSEGSAMRNRLPSASTSQNTTPAGTSNRGLGAPAWNTPLVFTSAAIAIPSGERYKCSLRSCGHRA